MTRLIVLHAMLTAGPLAARTVTDSAGRSVEVPEARSGRTAATRPRSSARS